MSVPTEWNAPKRLTLVGLSFLLDGGSFELHCHDEVEQPHLVRLAQTASPASVSGRWLPGRLYFDGVEVPIRSPQEAHLLGVLRSAEERGRGGEEARGLAEYLVKFVGSERYLEFAAQVDSYRLSV